MARDARKKNLIIARVGDTSLHRGWLGDPSLRSYDVWLDYYGEDVGRYAADPARLFLRRGLTKWQGLAALVAENREAIAEFDAVWLPDDDLAIAPEGIERLFDAFHRLDLALAQPALADGSYFSFEWLLESRRFFARFTNFVEAMAPLFSREALRACAGTFTDSVSGWGLDHAWPAILGNPRDRIAVIDAAPVLHTRPIAGGAWYAKLPVPPGEERDQVAARHGAPVPYRYRQYGGIPRAAGPDRSAALGRGPGLLVQLALGAPRSQRFRRRYYSRQLRSAVGGAVL
jgi:hypothetical protein